jgi:2-polyprenyl-3-methyl-5-hydroxy-6-metoxy-1,4-benzoquinol methylase
MGADRADLASLSPLLPENVFGHTKKVRLIRAAVEAYRAEAGLAHLSILDAGCGSGHAVTRFLASPTDEVLGVDLHAPSIDYAKARLESERLRFQCVAVESLALHGRTFDIIVMADILEHLDRPQDALRTAAALLTATGRLLITVPNGWGPFECESALARMPVLGPALLKGTDLLVAFLNKKTRLRGAWTAALASAPCGLPYNDDSGHVQFFTRRRIAAQISASGMRIMASRNLSFLSGPFTNYLWSPSAAFCHWNARVAERLPAWLASAWFFECAKAPVTP